MPSSETAGNAPQDRIKPDQMQHGKWQLDQASYIEPPAKSSLKNIPQQLIHVNSDSGLIYKHMHIHVKVSGAADASSGTAGRDFREEQTWE